jgi:hypothetical protein
MQHRAVKLAALGIASACLCAGLATTAVASSGHPAVAKSAAQSKTAARKAAAKTSVGASTSSASTDSSASGAASIAKLQREIDEIWAEIKASAGGPTAAQIAKQVAAQTQLLELLKADGRASAAQLAWLALTPAEKTAETVALDTGVKPLN